jgi:hypothetical protein
MTVFDALLYIMQNRRGGRPDWPPMENFMKISPTALELGDGTV